MLGRPVERAAGPGAVAAPRHGAGVGVGMSDSRKGERRPSGLHFHCNCLGLCSTRVVLPSGSGMCAEVRVTEIPSRSKGMREDKMPPLPEGLVQAHWMCESWFSNGAVTRVFKPATSLFGAVGHGHLQMLILACLPLPYRLSVKPCFTYGPQQEGHKWPWAAGGRRMRRESCSVSCKQLWAEREMDRVLRRC